MDFSHVGYRASVGPKKRGLFMSKAFMYLTQKIAKIELSQSVSMKISRNDFFDYQNLQNEPLSRPKFDLYLKYRGHFSLFRIEMTTKSWAFQSINNAIQSLNYLKTIMEKSIKLLLVHQNFQKYILKISKIDYGWV